MEIAVNSFCKRQTPQSKYSHFEGSWDELIKLVEEHFVGDWFEMIVAVDVPPAGFFSGVTKLTEDSVLSAEFSARREGEEPYVQITAQGKKLPAQAVKVILYHHDMLVEDEDTTSEEWEIVSINASASATGSEPPTPVAMARNFLEMAGGTKRNYSAEEFAEAIIFWSQHAMIG